MRLTNFVRNLFQPQPAKRDLYIPLTLLTAPYGTSKYSLFKEFQIREGHKIQFRWESFNFLNTPQLSGPDRTLGSATFGQITSTVVNNLEMQFGLKYRF